MSTKRVQTDEAHASNVASNVPAALWVVLSHGLSPDLTNALRNVGMRVRKNVLEGYAMNPNPQYGTSTSRMKAMSTGALYLSRDGASSTRGDQLISHPCPRKRHRSASPIDNEMNETCKEEESMHLDGGQHPDRPMKPLRRTGRPFTQTQSLPAGALFPGRSHPIPENNLRKMNEEEDDWSLDFGSSGTTFDSRSSA
ncbi:hypothetical protein EV360DRAFT_71482 [Lentinula raphanica]|nr:hypothetical protein EV360DRAFT_71482 [Lentinula raphanica]